MIDRVQDHSGRGFCFGQFSIITQSVYTNWIEFFVHSYKLYVYLSVYKKWVGVKFTKF